MSPALHVIMGGLSHPGQVRDENEDCIAMRPDLGLAVLADGMGGHQAGEVASRMAIEAITESLSRVGSRVAPRKQILNAIEGANTAIFEAAQARADYRGMGSTVVVALFRGDRLYVAHVGDSRLYRFRDGKLTQLTQDHSVVQELVNRGLFTPEEARQSLARNLVTRALGVDPTIESELHEERVRTGDIYLLCSDGLTDVVTDEQIAEILAESSPDVDAAAHRLIERANALGGPDNISVILALASA
ncbi:MAG TPA: Stp1/IreP family PP2C-type Ser/Thr phosphatase [Burkholderiales bacterium]